MARLSSPPRRVRSAHAFVFPSALFLLSPLGSACGDDPPEFSELERDAGIECAPSVVSATPPPDAGATDGGATGGMDASTGAPDPDPAPGAAMPCPDGEVCLQGRCYAACTDGSQCAVGEMCGANGACVLRTEPRRDAGPPDPCATVTCEGATPACHPVTGECVPCQDTTQCVPGSVCDLSRGVCRAFDPRPCSPCDNDVQCMDPETGMAVGACTMLEEDFERVCLAACDPEGNCPAGFACNDDMRCVPRVGSCTGWVAALDARACTADTDCVPFGTSPAAGQCRGATAETPGACAQPCGVPADCPAGQLCEGGFCRSM